MPIPANIMPLLRPIPQHIHYALTPAGELWNILTARQMKLHLLMDRHVHQLMTTKKHHIDVLMVETFLKDTLDHTRPYTVVHIDGNNINDRLENLKVVYGVKLRQAIGLPQGYRFDKDGCIHSPSGGRLKNRKLHDRWVCTIEIDGITKHVWIAAAMLLTWGYRGWSYFEATFEEPPKEGEPIPEQELNGVIRRIRAFDPDLDRPIAKRGMIEVIIPKRKSTLLAHHRWNDYDYIVKAGFKDGNRYNVNLYNLCWEPYWPRPWLEESPNWRHGPSVFYEPRKMDRFGNVIDPSTPPTVEEYSEYDLIIPSSSSQEESTNG